MHLLNCMWENSCYIRNTSRFRKKTEPKNFEDLVALQRRKQLYRHARRFEAARRKPMGSWPLYANEAALRLIGWVNILRVNHSNSAGGWERAGEVLLHLSACQPVCAPAHCSAASPEHVPLLNSQAAGFREQVFAAAFIAAELWTRAFSWQGVFKLEGVSVMFGGASIRQQCFKDLLHL